MTNTIVKKITKYNFENKQITKHIYTAK